MISTASTTGLIGQGPTTAAREEPAVEPSTAKDTLALDARAHESHRLPGTLASAIKARRLVGDFLDRLQHNRLAEAATLAISEIVTNAVTHGRPPYTST